MSDRRAAVPRYKIVVLGETGVGKSSLLYRWAHDRRPPDAESTIGASFSAVERDGCFLDFWDTAGQERYRSLVPLYARDAHVALIVDEAVSTVESRALFERWAPYAASDASIIEVRSKVDHLRDIGAPLRPREGAALASAWSGEGMETLLARIIAEARRVAEARPDPKPRIGLRARISPRGDVGWASPCC